MLEQGRQLLTDWLALESSVTRQGQPTGVVRINASSSTGNRLLVRQVLSDCDDDTVLFKVRREGDGNVCHLNRVSCFVPYVENVAAGEAQ